MLGDLRLSDYNTRAEASAQDPETPMQFFVVLARHWPALDGFDRHFQASVYFTLSSAVK